MYFTSLLPSFENLTVAADYNMARVIIRPYNYYYLLCCLLSRIIFDKCLLILTLHPRFRALCTLPSFVSEKGGETSLAGVTPRRWRQ